MNPIKHRYFVFVCSALLVGISACTTTKDKKEISGIQFVTDSLFNEKTDLRNYSFGMAREEFDLGDDSTILENEKDVIVEAIWPKTKDSTYAECSYHFENNLFQSAEINIFSVSDSLNLIAFDSLKVHLTRKFGTGQESRGFLTWNTKSKKGYPIEIFLGDMTYEIGSPTVQVQMHADLIEKAMLAHRK